MSEYLKDTKTPTIKIEQVKELNVTDMNDLCDATDEAIESGGGFGWVEVPSRDVLERFWKGVLIVPDRLLFVGRIDGVIGGTGQLIRTPSNNQAQSFSATVTNVFVAPWARGRGLGRKLMEAIEATAIKQGIEVLNLDVRETQNLAIKLYEKMGYEKWGTKPHYAKIDGDLISGHFYSKRLRTNDN